MLIPLLLCFVDPVANVIDLASCMRLSVSSRASVISFRTVFCFASGISCANSSHVDQILSGPHVFTPRELRNVLGHVERYGFAIERYTPRTMHPDFTHATVCDAC